MGRQLLLAGLGEEQLEQLRPEVPATLLEELRPLASLQLGRYMVTAVHMDVTGPVAPLVSHYQVGGLVDIRASDGMLGMVAEGLGQSYGMYYEGKLSWSYDVGVSSPDGMRYIKSESIMDLRKGGEVTVTDTMWYYHESQPEELMMYKVVMRACRDQGWD